jgi:phosphatidate cytidylyltransferase
MSMAASTKGQDHFKRWITGLCALPVLAACVVAGGIPFSLLVGLAGLACLREYFRLASAAGGNPKAFRELSLAAYATHAGMMLAAHNAQPTVICLALAGNVLLSGALSLRRFPSDRGVLGLVAREIQGVCYISLALALLILLRSAPDGMAWIFLLCAVIFAGDTAALYAGSLFGRHKLSPAISPGKTIEGAIGGLTANLIVGALGKAFFLPGLSWPGALLFAIAAGAAGQVGDLFESELKRASNIKDSGGFLPGHGGILDRIDALLFAAPVAFCLRLVFTAP